MTALQRLLQFGFTFVVWFVVGKFIGLIPAYLIAAFLLTISHTQRWRMLARKADATATTRIATTPEGAVELRGRAQPLNDRVLYDPILNAPCVWFAIKSYAGKIELRDRDDPNDTSLSVRLARTTYVKQACSTQSFVLQDSSGQCTVDPTDALMHLKGMERIYDAESNTTHAIWRIRVDQVLSIWGEYSQSDRTVRSARPVDALSPEDSVHPFLDENKIVISSIQTIQFSAHAKLQAQRQTTFSIALIAATVVAMVAF